MEHGRNYMSIEETSEFTGLSRGHLASLRFTGEGPKYYALTPRAIRYKLSDVVEWI